MEEEIGFSAVFTSLEHVGMISWEDVRKLKESLLTKIN